MFYLDEQTANILIIISQSQRPPMNTMNAKLNTVGASSSSCTTDPTPEWLLKFNGAAKLKTVGASSSSWTTDPTPEWLLKLMTEKNGAELKKIIEKELSASDVSRGHDRLSMPCSNIIDLEFLSPMEQRIIEEDEGKKHMTGVAAKLVVKLVDSDVLKEFDVNLRRCSMHKTRGNHSFVYSLISWKQVVEDEGCGLKKSDKIRLWSFHSDGKLYFALTTLSPPPPSPSSDSGDSKPEEIISALVIDDKFNDDLPPK
ncbi:unnamed protein product [Brassica oleracea var. botrytis]|nr:unnamed protein product [Brassica napus]